MELAESARRRVLAWLGVFAVLGFALLALLSGRQQGLWDPAREDLKAYDAASAPPPFATDRPAALPNAQLESSPPPLVAPAAPAIRNAAIPVPEVSPTAAPGVAFNYRYAFRLPAMRIAQVQEQHARACEQLGTSRCRITGMRFRVVNDRDVEAMLAFKLEPGIARRFGRAGADLVVRSEGMLIDSEISGTDVGTSIRTTGRNIAEMTEELERIEARLRQGGLSSAERTRLDYEAQALRQSIRAQQANREEQQESLATTPMVFSYASGALVPNLDSRPSFGRSAARAWDNFVEGIGILFIIFVTLLPWALLALLGWGIFRLSWRRWARGRPDAGAVSATEAPAFN
jgi:hypothetical protein